MSEEINKTKKAMLLVAQEAEQTIEKLKEYIFALKSSNLYPEDESFYRTQHEVASSIRTLKKAEAYMLACYAE